MYWAYVVHTLGLSRIAHFYGYERAFNKYVMTLLWFPHVSGCSPVVENVVCKLRTIYDATCYVSGDSWSYVAVILIIHIEPK